MANLLTYVIHCVFHLWYDALNGISKCNTVIIANYTISYGDVCYPVNRFRIQFSVLYRPKS
jgi:hypothetical protein